MHKQSPRYGIAQLSGESADTYQKRLKDDLAKAQSLITAAGCPAPSTFAYPFGKHCKNSFPVFEELGLKALLTCAEGISTVTEGNTECLKSLKRYNRSGTTSTAAFIKKVFGEVKS